MDYYPCSTDGLYREIWRRGYVPQGTRDQLSESLQQHDDLQSTAVTTIKTETLGNFVPHELSVWRTAELEALVLANALINEKIIYWSMNNFFPTLQLFFESGRSCTIDGGRMSTTTIGLDPDLHFRLTDCTHEQQGRIIKSSLPVKFVPSSTGVVIREAVIARRTSIAAKPANGSDRVRRPNPQSLPYIPPASIMEESHIVVGLRIHGMRKMAYVWARTRAPSETSGANWADVRILGKRNDVPPPYFGFPGRIMKPGEQALVVLKHSMIRRPGEEDVEISRKSTYS